MSAILLFEAIALTVPQFAQAATMAGTTITNTATVNFNVLGVAQTAATGSTSFVVDRKIDLLVTKKYDVITGPSSTNPTLVYLVTNNSNTTIRFGLSTQVSGTAQYTPTSVSIWKDVNGDNTYSPTDVVYADASTFGDVASGASVTVLVTATTPVAVTNGWTAGVSLVAQAYEPASYGSLLVIAATGGANNNLTVETVYADAAGSATAPADNQYDGKHSALAFFTVNASTVTVNKSSIVYADGLGTGFPNAKAIPGATVEYTVVVKNAAGLAVAQSVSLSDALPAGLSPVNGTWSTSNESGGPASCNNSAYMKIGAAAWVCAGSWSGSTLSVTVGDLSTGVTATVLFQATIQ
jgi:uncharacterized repeat protein (TIGR01451 family)